ncbi:MAG: hypothetical protein KDJ15_01810 [Alphaproteobacteria bacterium]|nr:hypothetical protein [Alphaproteobacteria bacterium]
MRAETYSYSNPPFSRPSFVANDHFFARGQQETDRPTQPASLSTSVRAHPAVPSPTAKGFTEIASEIQALFLDENRFPPGLHQVIRDLLIDSLNTNEPPHLLDKTV